ncbi:TRIC cation channel family protein, partial [Acinetobacter baumannii]
MLDQVPQLHHILEMFGVVLLAATGALAAIRARMDFLGAMVMSFIVGLGGGTMRDLLLNHH